MHGMNELHEADDDPYADGKSGIEPRPGAVAATGESQKSRARDGSRGPCAGTPWWLDDTAADFGAPQAVIDALVVQLGFQGTARLIADRSAFRAAVIAEARRQCARLRERLLKEEWRR